MFPDRYGRTKEEVRIYRKTPKTGDGYYETYVPNPLVEENEFLTMAPEKAKLPTFDQAKPKLPEPQWPGNEDAVACYWKAWELAFGNLRKPTEENGFVANFIDTMFNDCMFLWDSSFMTMFGKYGSRAFDFVRTMDNFYSKQHPDGFICREIGMNDGKDRFHRFDPTSMGPNILAWTEWESFAMTGDADRLRRVFPAVVAYHRWLRAYRTWPDGTYWSSGWGAGLDNQPRLPDYMSYQAVMFHHGHQAWMDACLQQLLSAKVIEAMAAVAGRSGEMQDFREEQDRLLAVITEQLWDEETAFFYDRRPDGSLGKTKTIGAYWALLADVLTGDRLERFVAHLDDPAEFKRPHRIPSLSADHPEYQEHGDYWRGAVWAPTNYMALRGLTVAGRDDLAHEIACEHLRHVVGVFKDTGTLWENYCAEKTARGDPSRPNFVGWTALAPITVLFEYVFGLRPDVQANRLVWDVRLTDEHGVKRYPFGKDGLLDLNCAARSSASDVPVVEASGNVPIELIVRWESGEETIRLGGNQ